MRPQSAKAKGRRLQQQVVQDLLAIFTHLTPDDIRSTSMGASGEDIQMSSIARKSIPFSFEAKNQERVNIWSSIEQAKTNTPAGVETAVVFKKNNEEPHIVLKWKTFLKMLKPISNNDIAIKRLHEVAHEINELASQFT